MLGACFFNPYINDPNLPVDLIRELRVQTTFFGAWRFEIETQPNTCDWTDLDLLLQSAARAGIHPCLKVVNGTRGGTTNPPEDLDTYLAFVAALATRFAGQVDAYAIENELDKDRLDAWTPEDYAAALFLAGETIHAADPTATVLDSGLTMQAYLMHWAASLPTDAALDMLARAEQSMRRKEHRLPDTPNGLRRWLATPTALRSLALVQVTADNPVADHVQLHYLQDAPEFEAEYLRYARSLGKPFELWEIGFGWYGDEFTEEAHAAGVRATLETAIREGSRRTIYEPFAEHGDKTFGRGLVGPDGPRAAAEAFRSLSTLKGIKP